MADHSVHISISLLWRYSRNSNALESEQLDHLTSCEDCLAILWLGKISDSIEHLKRKLMDHGIMRE